MIRNTKKAFTLVELIVVITILAILGTIAFISLQGYSGEARDSKRLSDINNLVKKVNIELSKGTSLTSLISTPTAVTGVTINGTGATVSQGEVDFTVIKENKDDFQDRVNGTAVNYPMSVTVGGSGTGAYKFMQIATVSEARNSAVVVGNYYKIDTNDSASIIKNSAGDFVVDNGSILPYAY